MDSHNIVDEFPDKKEKIHELKTSNHHFRKLYDEYHEVDKEIRNIEDGAKNESDLRLNELRHHRVHLKDSIYAMLN